MLSIFHKQISHLLLHYQPFHWPYTPKRLWHIFLPLYILIFPIKKPNLILLFHSQGENLFLKFYNLLHFIRGRKFNMEILYLKSSPIFSHSKQVEGFRCRSNEFFFIGWIKYIERTVNIYLGCFHNSHLFNIYHLNLSKKFSDHYILIIERNHGSSKILWRNGRYGLIRKRGFKNTIFTTKDKKIL